MAIAEKRRKLSPSADVQMRLLVAQLRGARMGRRESLEDVAVATGIARSTITLMENGHRDPSLGTFLMLADYYGLDFGLGMGEVEDDGSEEAEGADLRGGVDGGGDGDS